MTAEAVKNSLSQAYWITGEIETLREARRQAYDYATRVTASFGTGRQRSPDPHRFDRMAELDGLIGQKVDELTAAKTAIINTVYSLDDPRQRTVLIEHYITGTCFEDVASKMGYEVRQIFRIHRAALAELAATMTEEM